MKYTLIPLFLLLMITGVALGDTVDIQGVIRDAQAHMKDSVKGPEWLNPNDIPEVGNEEEYEKPRRDMHPDSMQILDEVVYKNAPIIEDSNGVKYQEFLVGTGEKELTTESFANVIWSLYLADETGMKKERFFKSTSGDTAALPVFILVPGWRQGVVGMKEGGVRRIYIPYDKAYGEAGTKTIPPKANMIIDFKLVKITASPQPPKSLRNQAKAQRESKSPSAQPPDKASDAAQGKP